MKVDCKENGSSHLLGKRRFNHLWLCCVCAAMAFKKRRDGDYICSELCGSFVILRLYSSWVARSCRQ
ncbi:hypothetical protein BRADI_1g56592v3 [Brachypodium distachyon]|uniref:Uncharacterized protein n=1 Tax=Brachypodium distachyon TaxID=15368 RepID=A0A2K2DRS6_BRADI|nr:hypothetical protein BRADI_1g56592v3 [Brachypodium distachyon]